VVTAHLGSRAPEVTETVDARPLATAARQTTGVRQLAGRRPSRGSVSRGRRPEVAAAWVGSVSARTGIDPVAVRAYGRATLELSEEAPTCRLGWTTLAGIGQIETGHGGTAGRTLRADGTTSAPILGPALDGRGFARVPATPTSTAVHGDTMWDHAVGPLQFIPSTWARWGADADGDGARDPNDIDDAALAAARYLCASGGDLESAEGWTAAVYSYNHSDAYVADVLAWANRYAE
jgi:membrane-bound lytic murein transglycosylase B